MPIIPLVDIYQDRATRHFMLLSYCEADRFSIAVPYGAMTKLSFDQMHDHGLKLVVDDLLAYTFRRNAGASEYDSLPETTRLPFQRQHKIVSISLQAGPELWIDPMHWIKGAKHMIGGQIEERKIVKLTDGQDVFFQSLCEALELAD